MNVCFINITPEAFAHHPRKYTHPRHILPPIDIGYCASVLEKHGHKTLLIDTALMPLGIEEMRETICKNNIETVVLKPGVKTYDFTLVLAKGLKGICKHIIGMGPVVSTAIDFFISESSAIDACVVDEPEHSLLELINKIEAGRGIAHIKGVAYFNHRLTFEAPRELCENLDGFPYPKHEFFLDKGYCLHYPFEINNAIKFAVMLTSRGCPYACLFCSPVKRSSYGKRYRFRTIENVIGEMQMLKSHGVNVIYFVDDLFIGDRKRTELFCEEVIQNRFNITWAAQIRANLADYALLSRMREAGCRCVNMGIESVHEDELKMLNKQITVQDVVRTVDACKNLGINVVGDFIIGTPAQTKEKIEKNFLFARQLGLDLMELLIFTPYPGSEAFKLYGKREDVREYSAHDGGNYSVCALDAEGLRRVQLQLYRAYYLDLKFITKFLWRNRKKIIRNIFLEHLFLKKVLHFLIQPIPR